MENYRQDPDNWYLSEDAPLLPRVPLEELPEGLQRIVRLLRGDFKVRVESDVWRSVYGTGAV